MKKKGRRVLDLSDLSIEELLIDYEGFLDAERKLNCIDAYSYLIEKEMRKRGFIPIKHNGMIYIVKILDDDIPKEKIITRTYILKNTEAGVRKVKNYKTRKEIYLKLTKKEGK
jgi:hypothetical protein